MMPALLRTGACCRDDPETLKEQLKEVIELEQAGKMNPSLRRAVGRLGSRGCLFRALAAVARRWHTPARCAARAHGPAPRPPGCAG